MLAWENTIYKSPLRDINYYQIQKMAEEQKIKVRELNNQIIQNKITDSIHGFPFWKIPIQEV